MALPADFTKLHKAEAAMELRMLKVKYARSASAAYRDSMRKEHQSIRTNFISDHADELPAISFLAKGAASNG